MRKQIVVFILGCLLLFASCVPDYRAIRNEEEAAAAAVDVSYIMVFEGERIDVEELIARVLLRVVLFEMDMGDVWETIDGFSDDVIDMFFGPGVGTAFERIKTAALNELVDSLIIRQHAARNGIAIADAERAEVFALASDEIELFNHIFVDGFPISIEMFASMILDDLYGERLVDFTANSITIDEPNFIEYFNIYREIAGNFVNTVFVYSIIAETYGNAQSAKARFEAGENVYLIARDYSVNYGDGFGRRTLRLPTWITMTPHEIDALSHEIFAMEQGQVTEIIPDGGEYFVIIVDEIVVPTAEALKEAFLDEMFAPYLFEIWMENWRRAAIVQINVPAFESIILQELQQMFELTH